MTLYAEEARLRAEVAEPKHGTSPLARLASTEARVARVAAHYGLSPEHAEALALSADKQAARDRLAADVAAFEARGGTVAVVPPGASGRVERGADGEHVWARLDVGGPHYA